MISVTNQAVTLNPFRDKGPDALHIRGFPEFADVRILELQTRWPNTFHSTLTQQAPNPFASSPATVPANLIPKTGEIVAALLAFYFVGSAGPAKTSPPNPTRSMYSVLDPDTGRAIPIPVDATLQERNLLVDDAHAAWALRRKQLQLEAILDDPGQCEPVKAELSRELQALYQYQQNSRPRAKDLAQKAVHAVRMALSRLQRHLAAALTVSGDPHPVLRPFAEHLEQYLLIPSARCSRAGACRSASGLAGRFTYEPPPGVRWTA